MSRDTIIHDFATRATREDSEGKSQVKRADVLELLHWIDQELTPVAGKHGFYNLIRALHDIRVQDAKNLDAPRTL